MLYPDELFIMFCKVVCFVVLLKAVPNYLFVG